MDYNFFTRITMIAFNHMKTIQFVTSICLLLQVFTLLKEINMDKLITKKKISNNTHLSKADNH